MLLLILSCTPALTDSGHAQEFAALDHEHALPEHEHEPDHAPYTDAQALAAVQNPDPWSDPERANLANLWHKDARGSMWLDQARWTMDNRTDPAAVGARHELLQLFHESVECSDGQPFADCNSTAAIKVYVNGPRITDNDWSEQGLLTAATRRYHTHASGLYLVSFGQNFTPSDYGYGVIAPSGIHLEPHGAHHGLRIDGTANAGENIRIEVAAGGTGLSIYGSSTPVTTCDALGLDCEQTRIATLRGGVLRLEDLSIERSALDARGMGVVTVSDSSLGVEPFYSWHSDPDTGLPVHCAWNEHVTETSLVKINAYSTSPDLLQAHSYAIVQVWGPGMAPSSCTQAQSIKTDAAGVYGYDFGAAVEAWGGFSVAILGTGSAALWPGDWQEGDRPSFLYEVIEPL